MNQEFITEMKNYFENLLVELEAPAEGNLEGEFSGPYNMLGLGKVSNGDDSDRAMDEREKALHARLQARRNFYQKKIKHALEKIENGNFGECEECGADISEERLKARPTATMCIHCKEEQEQVEELIPYKRRSHTYGQEIISA